MTDADAVLCVDDDAAFLDLTKTYLENAGFSVETATSGSEGLELLDAKPWLQGIVSDYQMPEMDGLAFLREVRDDHPNLPFLLFTGEGSEMIASEAINAGVTDYLQKRGPEQYDLLVNRLSNTIEHYEMHSEYERERRIRKHILEASPIGIVGHDETGGVIFRNDRAMELLGATDEDLDANNYAEAGWEIHNLDGTPVRDGELPFQRVVECRDSTFQTEYVLTTADGVEKQIRVFGAPLRDADNNVSGAVVAFYDTERMDSLD